jgi:hypothetical protein
MFFAQDSKRTATSTYKAQEQSMLGLFTKPMFINILQNTKEEKTYIVSVISFPLSSMFAGHTKRYIDDGKI